MAQIVNSGKKIEFLKGISNETVKFLDTMKENADILKRVSEDINQSTFVKTYNAVVEGTTVINEVIEEISTVLKSSIDSWSSVPGLATVAKQGFEEALTDVKKISSSRIEIKALDIPDDLHENVNDDNTKKFVTSLENTMIKPREYLLKISEVIGDTTTEDTKELYRTIGAGVEKVTNAFVRAYNANKDALKKWNVVLADIQDSNKAQVKNKMSSVENASSKVTQKTEADII